MSRPVNSRPDRVPDHLRWTRVSIECGKSLKGWIAGPVFGIEGHATPSVKPCHTLFTAGARQCPWCLIPALRALKYQGYLPMYDERLKKTVVCVNLDVTTQCDALSLLAPIEVGKGKYPTSPLFLKTGRAWTELKPSGATVRSTPQDIVPWLVNVLWKAEGLQEYGDKVPALAPMAAEPATPVEDPDGLTESARAALKRKMEERGWSKSALFFSTDGTAPKQPSTNGHHPKSKKE